jgi:hypothetical protein
MEAGFKQKRTDARKAAAESFNIKFESLKWHKR